MAGTENTPLNETNIAMFFVNHLFRFYYPKEIIKSLTTQNNLIFLCICDMLSEY